MTKKNKPASLTSSLLARKGEAEPAEARPYLVPESRAAGIAENGTDSGNDNGSGTSAGASKDLFGLGNFPLPELSEKSLRSTELEESAPPPATPTDPVAPTLNTTEDLAPPQYAAEPAAPALSAAEPSAVPVAAGTPDPEILDIEQETVRDARLLKFVYVMAALTGILAIVIYSGGWFIDDTAQKTAKQEAPWTPPAQTAAKSEGAVPAERPADGAPEKSASEDKPAAAMRTDAEKPVEQPADAEVAPEKSMAAASPELPASSRVLREGAGNASNPASTEIGSALPVATPSTGAPATGETSVDQPSSNQAARAPTESGTAVVADRQPPVSTEPSTSASSGASSGASADSSGMTDKVSPGDAASATVVAAVPAGKASTEAGPAMTAPPAQTKAAPQAEKAPVAMVAPSDGVTPLVKPTGRFLIQLSSVKSQERADREWARLKKSFPNELGNLELIIEKRAIASRGTFYRVQTGRFETISEARAICAVLAAKKQGCLPIKR